MSERTDAAIGRNIRNALASQLPVEDLDLLLRRYKAPELRSGVVALVRDLSAGIGLAVDPERSRWAELSPEVLSGLLGVELAEVFPAESQSDGDGEAAEE